jgi:diketogulonate reductase-like aldo/keto reductase
MAIDAGFRAIDTANQRRHYFEAGVGAAVSKAVADGVVRRDEVFLQTKFTYARGQDHRLPYDPKATPTVQVQQSYASSLEHLQVSSIDSYVLHGPSQHPGLGAVDYEVWRAMESLNTPHLGISNVSLDQLEELCSRVDVRPSFVQNRCFARNGWDRHIRAFCRSNDIRYQGFSLLTANERELQNPKFRQIVARVGKTPAQVVFKFAMQVGMIPLTGTTNADHMREDLAIEDLELREEDVHVIENIARR